jgi:hypothetical protein
MRLRNNFANPVVPSDGSSRSVCPLLTSFKDPARDGARDGTVVLGNDGEG